MMKSPALSGQSSAPPKVLSPVYVWLIGLFFLIAPIYVFSSGNPQPGDMLAAMLMIPALGLTALRHRGRISVTVLTGAGFVLLTIAVNLLHYSMIPHKKFLLSALYYAYNFSVFLMVSALFRGYAKQIRRALYIAVLGSIALQFIWMGLFSPLAPRATGTLNNPNQFAYWSLLTLIMLALLRRGQKFTALDYLAIACLLYFQLIALSKAGMIVSVLALFVLPFMKQFTSAGRFGLIIAALLILPIAMIKSGAISEKLQAPDQITRALTRLQDIGRDSDDSLKGRAYHRLMEHPEYLLLGAGEGAYERFDPARPIEIHSGIATLFFSYGIVGAALFFGFLLCVLRGQPWPYWALIGCTMLYGLTHQNIRFTHFWIALGLLHGTRSIAQPEIRPRRAPPEPLNAPQ